MHRGSLIAIVVALVTVLAATGCTADPEPLPETVPSAGSAGTGELSWQPCPQVPEEALAGLAPPDLVDQLTATVTYECATLTVPQDWDNPEAPETFDLELVRARSDAQQDRIGSLVINPGGPGGSGVEAAVHLSLDPAVGGLPEEVTRRFDVVGFDPRGVGRSDPVECATDEELEESFAAEPDPVDPEDFAEAVAESEQFAEQCETTYGDALDHISTRQTAHDMDAIRQAVGDDELTYLGFSYGTLLGSVYAQLYPDRIRAMTLDGAVDPEQDAIEASEGQAEGFERAFSNFAEWCDSTPDTCPLGPDTRDTVTGLIDQARESPVPGEDGREATAGWVLWSVIATLYAREQWPGLGAALDSLSQGDPAGVFALVDTYTRRDEDGSYPNMFDALTAVNCTDDDTELTEEQIRRLQQEWRQEYPLFGGPLAAGLLDCGAWPAEPDPYPTGPAEGAPPILVVGTTGDPATPYESTPRLAEMLGVGVVLTYEGEGHTAYPGSSPCVDDAVNAYLVDLEVPPDDTTCQ